MTVYEMLVGNGRSSSQPASWKKCSLSYTNGGCVEVAAGSGNPIRVRDSKNPNGTVLRFTPDQWDFFVGGVRTGRFDA